MVLDELRKLFQFRIIAGILWIFAVQPPALKNVFFAYNKEKPHEIALEG